MCCDVRDACAGGCGEHEQLAQCGAAAHVRDVASRTARVHAPATSDTRANKPCTRKPTRGHRHDSAAVRMMPFTLLPGWMTGDKLSARTRLDAYYTFQHGWWVSTRHVSRIQQ